jgi:hypothetical protein
MVATRHLHIPQEGDSIPMTANERDIERIRKVYPKLDGDSAPQVAYILSQIEAEPEKIEGEDAAAASKWQADRILMLKRRAFEIIKPYESQEDTTSV